MKKRERLLRELYSAPRQPEVDERKKTFAALNQLVTSRHGFLTSVPGDPEVRMECLPGSTLPDELRQLGYDVSEIGDGERILAAAITEHFTLNADGEFEPLVEGSTKPVAQTRRLVGIVKVKRYGFGMA
jgi:hypothetical protein